MTNEIKFLEIKKDLENKIHFLEDKPEETLDSSLKALWFMAFGTPMSAEKALGLPLPELTEHQITSLYQLIEQRINNVPLAHITKRQQFMGIELLSDARALIPRKETEILGKKALELSLEIANEKEVVNIIDTCCGSGNLGLAIAYFNPKAVVSSTDLSDEAVKLTQENISFLNLDQRVKVKQGDLLSAYETNDYLEKMDIIVCNPPYISSSKVQKMNNEISANEPVLAFDGGMLGINIIQKLIREAPKFLKKTGWLLFEVGVGQGKFIMDLLEKNHIYSQIKSVQDNAGNIRVIVAQI